MIAVDADQQTNGKVEELEPWVTGQPERQQERLVAGSSDYSPR